LNVLSVSLPPLRERADDVLLLARHFLRKYAQKFAAPARDFAPATWMKLSCYDWPGNVRELENVVERAVVLAEQALIQPQDIRLQEAGSPDRNASFHELKAKAIEQFERNYLCQALAAHDGNITKAAESAHKDRRAFWELLRKHRIIVRSRSSRAP
jgi:DNA-binding NtrC family response regulator